VQPFSLSHPSARRISQVDQLLAEKTLLGLYPRLHLKRPQALLSALMSSTTAQTRRIVHIFCGDGAISNWLSLHFPDIEIIGIDPDADNITLAQATVGQRQNLRFIHGQPSALHEIPCDRMLYSRPLSRLGNPMAFKKMFLKTTAWLVCEGDWVIEESLGANLLSPSLVQHCLQQRALPFSLLADALDQIGYHHPHVLSHDAFFGFQSQITLSSRVHRQLNLEELKQKQLSGPQDLKSLYAENLDELFRLSRLNHQWELG
jgi:hypothetical protein